MSYVSVPFEDDEISFSLDDSVQKHIASYVTHQGQCAFADVAFLPWPEGDLVSQVDEKRVHAVAFDGQGYGLSFGNQCLDFRVDFVFVYGDNSMHFVVS